jgi:hypothetical protein
VSVGISAKGALFNPSLGIAPGCKVEEKITSAESAIHFKTLVR